jgi:hypothetical protein
MRILVALLASATLLLGCKPAAEDFFSGRPSKMAEVHNRILAGPPEAMVELLRVPSRFPDATDSHIGQWQASAVAWWRHPQKHQVMLASFKKLSRDEAAALKKWLRVRGKSQPLAEMRALQEIEAAAAANAG